MNRNTRRLRLAQACLAGVTLSALLVGSLPPLAYTKDLQQEYLTAWALRDGIDIFTPVSQLSARYFPAPTDTFPHPNPHPPVLALIGIPLTVLPFPAVVVLWLVFNVALLAAVGRWLGFSVPGSLALAAWPPLLSVLSIGQFELLTLALAMLGWRAAAARRDWRAGLWLGCAAAIKMYPVFFLVPFAVRRRTRIVLAAGAVIIASQLGSLLVVGRPGLVRYYTEILPAVSNHYMHTVLNAAPYGAMLRLFGGASDVAPLIHAPGVVLPLTLAFSLFACAALVTLAPEAAPVAVLVALPAVWNYYVVLALPQVVVLLRSHRARLATLLAVSAASFVVPLASFVLQMLSAFMRWGGSEAPPVAALLMAVQPAGFLGLLLLSAAMGRRPQGYQDPVSLA